MCFLSMILRKDTLWFQSFFFASINHLNHLTSSRKTLNKENLTYGGGLLNHTIRVSWLYPRVLVECFHPFWFSFLCLFNEIRELGKWNLLLWDVDKALNATDNVLVSFAFLPSSWLTHLLTIIELSKQWCQIVFFFFFSLTEFEKRIHSQSKSLADRRVGRIYDPFSITFYSFHMYFVLYWILVQLKVFPHFKDL